MLIVILLFIGISALVAWYLTSHDHGRRQAATSLWACFGFGLVALVAASFLENRLLPDVVDPSKIVGQPLYLTLGFALAVGFIEEACKFIPLALFIWRKPYFREHTDGIIYFAICGLTFGMVENILYTLQFGSGAGLARLVMTPFFHAASVSILGYYLVSYKSNPALRSKFIAACILIPVLHGLYDFGLFSQINALIITSVMITVGLSVSLFLYFMQANVLDKAASSARAAVAVPTHLETCPTCGASTQYGSKFCEHCGSKIESDASSA